MVSIHAPVWGATGVTQTAIADEIVSIHAPVWGATSSGYATSTMLMFQSTHPCGVRLLA